MEWTRKEKAPGSILKQVIGAGLVSTLFKGGRHKEESLPPSCSPKGGLPLQRILYKSNRNQGTKKGKRKKEKQLV